ncbi:MAG TPA: hypothetical protein VGK48_06205 [Terriglobia bacterium]
MPTCSLVLLKEHARRTKPPRALFVPFPYGYALGKPDDAEFQHRVLSAALDLFGASAPVLAEFPEAADAPVRLIQASEIVPGTAKRDPADDLTSMRGYYERWLKEHDGRTAVGNSGIPQRRFRGLVRFLEAYAAGAPEAYPEKPAGTPAPLFIRRAADDLKAFMLEARMQQRPHDRDNALYEWFWSQTALGPLLVRVAQRLKEEGEEKAAFGIVR